MTLALERFGRVDILVSNAGCTLNRPFIDTSAAEWDAVMTTNVRGAFLHMREATRATLPSGGDAIVQVASMVASVGMELAACAASNGTVTHS